MDVNMIVPSHMRNDETGERLSAQVVVVSDIDMPFMSMVVFMIKFVIAAIPAALLFVTLLHFVGMFAVMPTRPSGF